MYIILIDPIVYNEPFFYEAVKLNKKIIAIFTFNSESEYINKITSDTRLIIERNSEKVIFAQKASSAWEALKDFKGQISAIIPIYEKSIELAEQISHMYGTLGNSKNTSTARRDKGDMKSRLKDQGLPLGSFNKCTTQDDATNFFKKNNNPVVLKSGQPHERFLNSYCRLSCLIFIHPT